MKQLKKNRLILLFLLIPFTVFPNEVGAEDQDLHPIIKEKGEILEEESTISSRLLLLNEEINQLRAQENSLQEQISSLEISINKNTTLLHNTKEQIFSLQKDIALLKKGYEGYAEKLDKRNELLKERIRNLQEGNGFLDYVMFLLDSENMNNLIDRSVAVMTVIEADRSIIEQIKEEQINVSKQLEVLDSKNLELSNLEQEYQLQQNSINMQKQEKSQLLQLIKEKAEASVNEKNELDNELSDLKKKRASLEKSIQSFSSSDYSGSSSQVPAEFIPFYKEAEEKFGVDSYILAAIHSVETNFSKHPTMISSMGALGHMQFLEATWAGYRYENGKGKVKEGIDITDPAVIKLGNGYGVDMDNDGIADPFNIRDSIGSAANYLSAHGYSSNPAKAIWHYNHAQWYVDKVLSKAKEIKENNDFS